MSSSARLLGVFFATITIASACAGATSAPQSAGPVAVGQVPELSERQLSEDFSAAAVPGVYDPVRAGEALPRGFRPILGRDAILPVYVPTFVSAEQIEWSADSLIIGVDLEGEARAYPVGFLNRREIVVDNHRGIPTLVTW